MQRWGRAGRKGGERASLKQEEKQSADPFAASRWTVQKWSVVARRGARQVTQLCRRSDVTIHTCDSQCYTTAPSPNVETKLIATSLPCSDCTPPPTPTPVLGGEEGMVATCTSDAFFLGVTVVLSSSGCTRERRVHKDDDGLKTLQAPPPLSAPTHPNVKCNQPPSSSSPSSSFAIAPW